MDNLTTLLEPIASQFRALGIPQPIVQWGHPAMMGIVIFVMGTFVGWAGWRGRVAPDKEVAIKNRQAHRKLAPWMFLFIALGYTGGVLSLVMQKHPILESGHFWTGCVVLVLLTLNSLLALGFGGDRPNLRTAHAYVGTTALGLMFLHAVLGLKLGLSL
jgi:hypothetical protein